MSGGRPEEGYTRSFVDFDAFGAQLKQTITLTTACGTRWL
jgi:hypothetical protein